MKEKWLKPIFQVFSKAIPEVADSNQGNFVRGIFMALGLYVMVMLGLGVYWNVTPDTFDVRGNAAKYTSEMNQNVVTGSTTVSRGR